MGARGYVLAAVATAALVAGCASPDPTPAERLGEAIARTQEAGSFEFTLDGEGTVTRGEANEDLFFASTGRVVFPDRVLMTVNIDQPSGGARSEVLSVSETVYVRPAAPGAKWQRSSGPVELAGFDPLAAFDFDELQRTRVASDEGHDVMDGIAVRKIRLDATEQFRAQVESRLPSGFEGTTLELSSDLWIELSTRRIVRVVQRYDYSGATSGFFQTDLRLTRFGAEATIQEPAADQVAEEPLILPDLPG